MNAQEMREECIALEAASMAAVAIAAKNGGKSYADIAKAAIDKVDAYAAREGIEFLYGTWTRDWDE